MVVVEDKYRVRLDRKELREAGMKTLVGEYYRTKKHMTISATANVTWIPPNSE
jgi:hypothetical protein